MTQPNIAANDQTEIEERDIHRTKCLLNAAIPASLNGKPAEEIAAVKSVVFEILDSEDPVFESAKGALVECDLFDAAQILEFKAHHMHDRAAELFVKAAVLFAPVMTVKSILAFENAQVNEAELTPYRTMMARLYRRMGNPEEAVRQESLVADISMPEPTSMDLAEPAVLIQFPK